MDRLETIMRAIVEGTKESHLDTYIDRLVYKEQSKFDDVPMPLPLPDKEALYISRLEAVSDQIRTLLTTVSEDPRFEHRNKLFFKLTLALALKLHLADDDRADGTGPFVSHILAVTQRVLSIYKEKDAPFVAMAALLHDAVEDQATLLNIQKRLAAKWNTGLTNVEIEREGAIEALRHFVGMRSGLIVEGVTTPLHDKKQLPQESKNEIYYAWAEDIVYDANNPARFVVKWCDWEQNAFRLNVLLEAAHRLRQTGDSASAEKKEALAHKLKGKYQPVLKNLVLPFLQNNMPESHPLFYMRDEMIETLEKVLKEQYS